MYHQIQYHTHIGTHWDYQGAADILKEYLLPVLKELNAIDPEKRIEQRIEKFGKMGFWEETTES
jgi:acetyl-CoA carboxylase carboxyl transferase subunit alpha